MKFTAWHGLAGFFALQLGGCPFLFDTNVCGDADVDAFEECDDGNSDNTDACSNACTATFCGDGVVQPGFEECDDGNQFNGDGCDALCFEEIVSANCGDGFVDAGEGCDDGNNNNFDGCAGNCTVEQVGNVLFDYVLLRPGANSPEAALNCAELNVADVHFMLGNDLNGGDVLDNNEIIQEAFVACNQLEDDGDGVVDVGDLGIFDEVFFAGNFDLFAIEFLDVAGNPILWETFDTTLDAERFSFSGGFTVVANANTLIPFNADPQFLPQLAQELQAFFGF